MTLLITAFAAIITTILWYNHSDDKMKLGTLSLMYWGASLMWFVDAVAQYIELGSQYFTPEVSDMINDAYLGFSVVAIGLIIWLIIVLVKDPKDKLRQTLSNKYPEAIANKGLK